MRNIVREEEAAEDARQRHERLLRVLLGGHICRVDEPSVWRGVLRGMVVVEGCGSSGGRRERVCVCVPWPYIPYSSYIYDSYVPAMLPCTAKCAVMEDLVQPAATPHMVLQTVPRQVRRRKRCGKRAVSMSVCVCVRVGMNQMLCVCFPLRIGTGPRPPAHPCAHSPSVRPASLITSAKRRHSLMLPSKLVAAREEKTREQVMPTPSRKTQFTAADSALALAGGIVCVRVCV